MNLFAKGHKYNPLTEEDKKEVVENERRHQEWKEQRKAEMAQKLALTYTGGGNAEYQDFEHGIYKVVEVKDADHWHRVVERAKENAQRGKKLLTVINPNRDSNPYELGCPKNEYDYRQQEK